MTASPSVAASSCSLESPTSDDTQPKPQTPVGASSCSLKSLSPDDAQPEPQTSVGASQTAESIGNLAHLAGDLRRSVADFKLPG